ncbi:MAG: type II secretion system GspH family protein [Oscillospiraceae bacterium]|nr:type II secretion system GspH family protein [Oscillospiraceae bacterium]
MKDKKLKGFTLIELIVVMAIFGIILIAAMQLLLPASKVMVQSEHYENQQAVVTNISNYLESVLTPAEFMDAYNGNRDPATIAQSYAVNYYEGVLKSGCDVNSPVFATGKIHVLELDNSGTNTVLKNYVYDADFTTGSVSVAYNSSETVNNAINNAYYDNYNLQIRVGSFDESTWGDLISQPDFQRNVSASNTVFTIKSETKSAVNGSVHTSYNTAFMALGNIFNSSTANLNYYVIDEKAAPPPVNPLDPPDPNILSIVQIATPNITARQLDTSMTNARWAGTLLNQTRNDYTVPTDAIENYYFVYSYGSDINTNS